GPHPDAADGDQGADGSWLTDGPGYAGWWPSARAGGANTAAARRPSRTRAFPWNTSGPAAARAYGRWATWPSRVRGVTTTNTTGRERARLPSDHRPWRLRGRMCSREKLWCAKAAGLRQYSHRQPARSATNRRSLARPLAMNRRHLDPHLPHQRADGYAAQLGQFG